MSWQRATKGAASSSEAFAIHGMSPPAAKQPSKSLPTTSARVSGPTVETAARIASRKGESNWLTGGRFIRRWATPSRRSRVIQSELIRLSIAARALSFPPDLGAPASAYAGGRGSTLNYSYPLYCSCLRNGDRVALVGRAEEVTYAELERRIAGLGAGLRSLGLAGKAVAALTGNEPEAVELYMALARAGAVAVPLNTRLAAPELRFALEDSEAVAIVADPHNLAVARGLADELGLLLLPFDADEAEGDGDGPSLHSLRATDPGPPPGADDGDERAAATIIYTSGTTGLPKGVVRSHRANAWNAVNSALGAPRTPDDVEVFNLPIFGIGFLHFLMPALLGGATVVLDRRLRAGPRLGAARAPPRHPHLPRADDDQRDAGGRGARGARPLGARGRLHRLRLPRAPAARRRSTASARSSSTCTG